MPEQDDGLALILETKLPENDMRSLQIWMQEVLEKDRERCAKIVEEATKGNPEVDTGQIVRAIRLAR